MGESQIATLPDSQNHHHVATGATAVIQIEGHQIRITYSLSRTDNRHSMAKGCCKSDSLGGMKDVHTPWWSASGDLTARTIKARPAQGTPWWSASGVAPSSGCSIHLGVQVPTQSTGTCPMEVSQWGLDSKNNQSRTGLGHSMVVSQWSSSEHRVLQSTWRSSAHPERCRARLEGGESSCSYRFHGESPHSELPNPERHRVYNDNEEEPPSPDISQGHATLALACASARIRSLQTQTREVRRSGDGRAHITLVPNARISIVLLL